MSKPDIGLYRGVTRGFDQDKTVYVPYMSDHGYALIGAFRHHGIKARPLEKPDEECLRYGRQYSEGGECLPFVVTTGQFIKLLKNDSSFDPEKSAFFMPTSSGPCRFGQYHAAQNIIFNELGYDIDLISLEAYSSYEMDNLGLSFRRLAWHGIVAVDYLQKLLWHNRPYEVNQGETEQIYEEALDRIIQAIEESGIRGLLRVIKQTTRKFESISIEEPRDRPVIGIVGEIYVRANELCNSNIVKMIESLGGEVRVAPMAEWFYYTNRKEKQDGWRDKNFVQFLKGWAKDLVQHYDEQKLGDRFDHLLEEVDIEEPSVARLVENSEPYISEDYRGEPVLEVGKAIDYAIKGASGIVTVVPFSCMPGSMIISVSNLVREDYEQIPWLNLTFDAQQSTNLKTRLEAFMFQAERFSEGAEWGEG